MYRRQSSTTIGPSGNGPQLTRAQSTKSACWVASSSQVSPFVFSPFHPTWRRVPGRDLGRSARLPQFPPVSRAQTAEHPIEAGRLAQTPAETLTCGLGVRRAPEPLRQDSPGGTTPHPFAGPVECDLYELGARDPTVRLWRAAGVQPSWRRCGDDDYYRAPMPGRIRVVPWRPSRVSVPGIQTPQGGEKIWFCPSGTLPRPTAVGGTVPVPEEAGLGPLLSITTGLPPIGSHKANLGRRQSGGLSTSGPSPSSSSRWHSQSHSTIGRCWHDSWSPTRHAVDVYPYAMGLVLGDQPAGQ